MVVRIRVISGSALQDMPKSLKQDVIHYPLLNIAEVDVVVQRVSDGYMAHLLI